MEALIEEVKSHPCLWSTADPDYKNINTKTASWEAVANNLNKTVDTVKKEWKCLRDGLRQAMKAKHTTKSGQKAQKVKAWHYEKYMEFLKPSLSFRRTEENTNANEPRVLIEAEDMEEGPSEGLQEFQEFSEGDNREVPVPSPSTSIRVQQMDKNIRQNSVDKVISYLECNRYSKDDLGYFFKSMCETTRKLPVLKQIQLRRQINDLVLSALEEQMLEQYAADNYDDQP